MCLYSLIVLASAGHSKGTQLNSACGLHIFANVRLLPFLDAHINLDGFV
jgi:hypothetical protein